MDERLKILNNIIDIYDNDNNILEIKNIKLEFSCNKYSSKKNNIYHITLNDKSLSKNDKLYFKYKCITCNNIHIVATTQFLRKINKCSYRCNLCMVITNTNKEEKILKKNEEENSLIELREESIKLFNEYDDDFKDKYFAYHLTDDDIKRLSKNIISIQNGKYKIEDLEYWSIFKTNNQMLFTSVFYNKTENLIIRANQPILKCENCNNEWRAKLLERYKNCYKVMCSSCTLCNKTFKIRTTTNNINDKILYQSKLELKFIDWCNNHGLTVYNGPHLKYSFENKERTYKVDFRIKDLLIEVKDNHIWHRNEVKSGKRNEKENAIYKSIKEGLYKEYFILTPKNWINTLDILKSK